MAMILSIVILLTHQCCRVSTIHIPTFRQQCNLSPRYDVSANHPFPSVLFDIDYLLQLEQVVPHGINSNEKNILFLQILCCNVRETHLHRNNKTFFEFLWCRISQFYNMFSFVETSWLHFKNIQICSDGFWIFTGLH